MENRENPLILWPFNANKSIKYFIFIRFETVICPRIDEVECNFPEAQFDFPEHGFHYLCLNLNVEMKMQKKEKKNEHQGWKGKYHRVNYMWIGSVLSVAPAYIDFQNNNNKNYPLIIFHSYSVCIISLKLNGNADFPLLFVEAMQVAQHRARGLIPIHQLAIKSTEGILQTDV